MFLHEETINFLKFVLVGIVFAVIFDFFRAYRKYKKVKKSFVIIQDIIFLTIVFCITTIVMLNFLNAEIRIYHFFAIVAGICIYLSTISKLVIQIYIEFLKASKAILKFIFLPINLIKEISTKILKKVEKISKKGCNKFKNVVFNICTKIKSLFNNKNVLKDKKIKVKRVKIKRQKR